MTLPHQTYQHTLKPMTKSQSMSFQFSRHPLYPAWNACIKILYTPGLIRCDALAIIEGHMPCDALFLIGHDAQLSLFFIKMIFYYVSLIQLALQRDQESLAFVRASIISLKKNGLWHCEAIKCLNRQIIAKLKPASVDEENHGKETQPPWDHENQVECVHLDKRMKTKAE